MRKPCPLYPEADIVSHSITSSARVRSLAGTVKTERLGSLEIDNKLEFGRRLHRQVAGLFAFEDAVDVACRLTELVRRIDAVRHQAACH